MTVLLAPDDVATLHAGTLEECNRFYNQWWDLGWPYIAELARKDRFFLLVWLLNREDANREWIYRRCREVEAAPDGFLDLWAREHYKSSVITFAGVVQEILRNPEITVGIFSFNNQTAKKFLKQIKREFEANRNLLAAFPDVLWRNPEKQAPMWSEEKGIIVRRRGNPKEATCEAHGLIDGMPTGAHYDLRVYDDIITEREVTTPDMMQKALDAWRLSQNLGKEGGRRWHIGTRYHFNDPYAAMLTENILKPRVFPATADGAPDGPPVLVNAAYMAEKRKDLGPYIFSCQWLLNPVADQVQGFKREWLRHYDGSDGQGMNVYMLVDPANEKKKHSDYTAIWIVGLNSDRNYYVLDILRDRLNLTERADKLFELHRAWKPTAVGYEKYGISSDIQHFQERMERENYRFNIVPLAGNTKKEDRIRRLIPLFEQGRVYLPDALFYDDFEGKKHDLVREFIEQEYLGFPVSTHDDMLDALARILDPDMPTVWPMPDEQVEKKAKRYGAKPQFHARSWMSM